MTRKYRLSREPLVVDEKAIFLNMKSSPSGPSTMTSWRSSLKLAYNEIQCLYNLLGEKVIKIFDINYKLAFENFANLEGRNSLTSGKLAVVHDAEGKERVIAMMDY
jgi:hypothetical protein